MAKLLIAVAILAALAFALFVLEGSVYGPRRLAATAAEGLYAVGIRVGSVAAPERTTQAMVWYPARPPGVASWYEPLASTPAAPDPGGAPYPLIVFSHGLGGCGSQSSWYTANLASHGYVVVAPDHVDAAFCFVDGRAPAMTIPRAGIALVKARGDLGRWVQLLFADRIRDGGSSWLMRAAEVSATIDAALAWSADPASPFHGLIDPERIGLTGHSAGGVTSLLVGGFPLLCDELGRDPGLDRARALCSREEIRNDPQLLRDPRVRAIAPLAPPAMILPNLERGAEALRVPLLLITGGARFEVPPALQRPIYDHAPPPRYFVVIRDTDHATITDVAFRSNRYGLFLLPGYRSHFADKARVYKRYSAAFFDKFLKEDSSGDAVLHAPLNELTVLSWAE